jgi:hypothetical protein
MSEHLKDGNLRTFGGRIAGNASPFAALHDAAHNRIAAEDILAKRMREFLVTGKDTFALAVPDSQYSYAAHIDIVAIFNSLMLIDASIL